MWRLFKSGLVASIFMAFGDDSVGQQGVVSIDNSGKGAVLCNWGIWIDLRNIIDACFPSEYVELRSRLDEAIDATNAFIVANSPTPVTKEELEAHIAKRLSDARAKAAAGPQKAPICKSEFAQVALPEMSRQSREEFRRGLADFLSVPRRPAMNPCL